MFSNQLSVGFQGFFHGLLLRKVVMSTLLNLLSEVKMEGGDQVISLIQAGGMF